MQQQTFQRQQNVYKLLWNIIHDVIRYFKKGQKTPDDLKLLKKAKQRKHKLSRTFDIMKKRQNIESRGFDTNAYVSYKQSLNQKQAFTIISQMQADKNKDGSEPDEDDMYATVEQHHIEELEDTNESILAIKDNFNPQNNFEELFFYIDDFDKEIRSYDIHTRRQNIETRGYDTNVTITRHEYRKHEAALEQENATETENPPALIHLHSEMQEYEKNLPEALVGRVSNPETNDQNITIITDQPTPLKQPKPIIQYHPKGFRPYGQMQDVFNSHAPVKIVGGTYDAGKTYSCVAYIDHLARNYPGARLTFIHRHQNRIYHNIIPTYEKYLGFKPTSVDNPNPTPIAKYGGELPMFYEYCNGSRIYMGCVKFLA